MGLDNGGGGWVSSGVPGTGVDARLFGAMTILLNTVGVKYPTSLSFPQVREPVMGGVDGSLDSGIWGSIAWETWI